VDYQKIKLSSGDLLMLSTDGVHDFISNKALSALLAKQHISLEVKAQCIIEQALNNGSDDNLSCLLVKVASLGEADIEENYRQLSQLAFPPALAVGNLIEDYKVIEVLFSGTRSYLYKVLNQKDNLIHETTILSSVFTRHYRSKIFFMIGGDLRTQVR
jgi:hypothetical protein